MKAIVIKAPYQAETLEREIPVPKKDEALLKMLVGGICGSDLASYRGQSAYVSYPRTIGHEFAAEVVEIAENKYGIRKGTIVTGNPYFNCGKCYSCRRGFVNCCVNNETMGVQREGAFSEYFTMPIERIYGAEGIEPTSLALIEPFCISYHGVGRAAVRQGEKVLIIGAGAIGILAGITAKIQGAEIYVCDIAKKKVDEVIEKFGFDGGFINDTPEALSEFVGKVTNGDGFDVAVEAAGSPGAFLACIRALASRGRMVQIGVAKKNADFNFLELQRKELSVYGSRAATKSDFMATMDLVKTGRVDLTKLISKTFTIDDAGISFATLDRNSADIVKAEFDFRR